VLLFEAAHRFVYWPDWSRTPSANVSGLTPFCFDLLTVYRAFALLCGKFIPPTVDSFVALVFWQPHHVCNPLMKQFSRHDKRLP
jgi:hypothetical protein